MWCDLNHNTLDRNICQEYQLAIIIAIFHYVLLWCLHKPAAMFKIGNEVITAKCNLFNAIF